jgi:hypothetical protein
MLMFRFLREQSGAAMVEMTIVMMLLFTLVLGFVDFGYAFYQWNAANKAVQVGARLAAVSTPVPTSLVDEADTTDTGLVGEAIPSGEFSYSCTADAAGVPTCDRCDDADACASVTTSQTAFDLILDGDASRPGMRDFFPALQPDEVQIEYIATGLGYWTRPGGPVPTVRVSIVNRTFDFFFLSGLLSFTPITMPDMLSTVTGEDLSTTY